MTEKPRALAIGFDVWALVVFTLLSGLLCFLTFRSRISLASNAWIVFPFFWALAHPGHYRWVPTFLWRLGCLVVLLVNLIGPLFAYPPLSAFALFPDSLALARGMAVLHIVLDALGVFVQWILILVMTIQLFDMDRARGHRLGAYAGLGLTGVVTLLAMAALTGFWLSDWPGFAWLPFALTLTLIVVDTLAMIRRPHWGVMPDTTGRDMNAPPSGGR
jgi:hypothetical protein